MLRFLGRSAVACLISANIACALSIADSRDSSSYKVISSTHLNWFSTDLKYKKTAAFINSRNTYYYAKKDFAAACPVGTHVPSQAEWSEILSEHFVGTQKLPNMNYFAGQTHGYYVEGSPSLEGGRAAFFAIKDADNKAMMFDLDNGAMRPISVKPNALLTIRCVNERDSFTELGISKENMLMTDSRDGQKYPIAIKGNKVWFTKNLQYESTQAQNCYMEDLSYCKKFGRFYTYTEALTACPRGWHLPDDGEWRDFQKNRDSLDWDNLGIGGCKDWDEYCDSQNTGHYWSASTVQKGTGRSWEFRRKAKSINRTDENTQKGLYVRCVTQFSIAETTD